MFDAIRRFIPSRRPPQIVALDFETFGTDDMGIHRPAIVWQKVDREEPDSFADLLEATGFIGRVAGKSLLSEAAVRIRRLVAQLADAEEARDTARADLSTARREAYDTKRKLQTALYDAKSAAKDLSLRTEMAIEEMTGSCGRYTGYVSGRKEKPAAILYSPRQFEELTMHGMIRGSYQTREDLPSVRTFNGIPVYVAKGVYGPVVLTEEAFAGVSRMAPELHLKARQ